MTDPTPTRAEAVAHILGLRHMSGDDLHLPSAADFIERLAAENQALRKRAEAAEAERDAARDESLRELMALEVLEHWRAQLTAARRAEAAAWNDAIEAAAEKCDVVFMDHIGDLIRAIGADIRALRRAAPTEGEA